MNYDHTLSLVVGVDECMQNQEISKMASLIQELYSIIQKLESNFPGRHFTPDGHLVGSIGEVLASNHYGLELLPASYETHDAKTTDGKFVQIKATQGKSIGIRSEPDHLLVLKIILDGTVDEVYNGPGNLAWENASKMQKNGQRQITVKKLKTLMINMDKSFQLPKI